MRSAQKLLKKTGISIFIVLLLIGVVKDYVLVPLMSKGWSWALTTTPDGFISNANALETMKHSPWILLIGFVLLLIYTLFAMWEMSAALLGIAYGYQGQNIKMADLFKISWSRVREAAYPGNWMILVFTAIILPFSNMYQATEFIGAFVSGEYYDLPYADFFSVEHTFLTRGMVRQLHLRGKEVYVWTVNHAAQTGKLRTDNKNPKKQYELPLVGEEHELTIVVDDHLIEIYVDQGKYVLSNVVYHLGEQISGQLQEIYIPKNLIK